MTAKKLIEVALPPTAVNVESAREKSIRHGHPSTLHLWWARRPLATCRAVLFAQMVDDPSAHPDMFPSQMAQEQERQRLLGIVRELVKWENLSNTKLLAQAGVEMARSSGGSLPSVFDPFCGGGSIPLEAQRLGLRVHASDLNPVAVIISKSTVEIPHLFGDRPPVRPKQRGQQSAALLWPRASGLAEDVRYYGRWMRDKAQERIGHLYPKVEIPEELGGKEATVVAWLWARTVASPNPACNGAHVPLVRSFWLSKKRVWIEPIVDRAKNTYHFEVRTGAGEPREGTVTTQGPRCLLSDVPIPFEYIRTEAQAGLFSITRMFTTSIT